MTFTSRVEVTPSAKKILKTLKAEINYKNTFEPAGILHRDQCSSIALQEGLTDAPEHRTDEAHPIILSEECDE